MKYRFFLLIIALLANPVHGLEEKNRNYIIHTISGLNGLYQVMKGIAHPGSGNNELIKKVSDIVLGFAPLITSAVALQEEYKQNNENFKKTSCSQNSLNGFNKIDYLKRDIYAVSGYSTLLYTIFCKDPKIRLNNLSKILLHILQNTTRYASSRIAFFNLVKKYNRKATEPNAWVTEFLSNYSSA